MHHHRILRRKGLILPDSLINLLRRENPAPVLHQKLHDLRLRSSQSDRFSVRIERAFFQTVTESAIYDLVLPAWRMDTAETCVSAQLAFHPGRQLLRVKRFRHIIVRSHGESQNLVRILRLCTQHNDRQIFPLSDLHHGGQSVKLWHHHIHDDKLYLRLRQDPQRLHAVVGLYHTVPFLFQQEGDCLYDLSVVVHHQHTFVHLKTVPPYP